MPYLQAGVDRPFGATPYGRVLRIRAYNKDSGAAAIYPGDFVILETDGGLGVSAAGSTTIVGVAAEYSAASTAKTDFLVYDHPEQEFAIQDDGDTTAMNEASIGTKVNLIVTTGDTTTLRSLHEIDSSSAATTSTLACSVVGLHPIEARDFATAAGSPRKWVVKINNHINGFVGRTGI